MKVVYLDFDETLVDSHSFQYLYFIRSRMSRQFRDIRLTLWYVLCLMAFPVLVVAHLLSGTWRDRMSYFFYRGLDRKDIFAGARLFFRERPIILRKEVVDFVREKRRQGYVTVIVSGSFQEIIQAALLEFGLTESIDHCLAASLKYSDEIAIGSMVGRPLVEREKVVAIREFELQQKETVSERICISDSFSDLPLLQLAQRAIVVNPKKKLKKYAGHKGWEVWLLKSDLGK